MHSLLTTEWQLHGLVVPGWRVHSGTELAVTLFIVAVAVLVQSAVKAAEQAVRTTFNVKSSGRKLLLRAFGALLLAVDAIIGYLLMVVVMSGSVWLLLTVVAASGLGYALIWWAVVPRRPRLSPLWRPLPGRRGDGTDAVDSRTAGGIGGAAATSAAQAAAVPETRPLMEPAAMATAPARDSAARGGPGGAAQPAVNGIGKAHVLTTFSANPPAAPGSPSSELPPARWSPERERLLACPPSWQSKPASVSYSDSNGDTAFEDGSAVVPAPSDFDYGRDGWAELGGGGDLYNKYPVLTEYRKLDVDLDRAATDTAAVNLELSELDSALQELSSFQHLPA